MANPQTDEYESDPEDAPLHSLRRREASDDESTDGKLPARRDPRGQTSYEDDSDEQCGVPGSDDDEELVLVEEEVVKGSDDDKELVLEAEEVAQVIIEEMEKDRGEKQYVSVSGSLIGQNLRREVTGFRDTDQAAEQYDFPTESFYLEDSRYRGNERRGRQRSMPGGRKLWQVNDDHRFGKMNLNSGRSSEDGQVTSGRFQRSGSGTGLGYFGDNRSEAYHNENNNDPQNYNRSNYARNNDRTSYHGKSNQRGTGRGYVRSIRSQAHRDQNKYNRSNSNFDRARYDRRNYYKSNGPSDNSKSNGSENYNTRDYARNNNRRNYGRNNGPNNNDPRNYAPNNDRINYDRSNYNHRNFPRSVRGKDSTSYVLAQNKSNELAAYEQKQSTIPEKPNPEISVGRQSEVWNLQPEPVLPQKNVFFSNLNPSAQPYYPTGSSLIDPSFPSTQCLTDRIINSDNMIARNSIINPLLQSSESSLLPQSTIRSSYLGIPDSNTNTLPNNRRLASLNQVASVPLQIHPLVQPALASFRQQPDSDNQALDLYQDPTSICFEHEESQSNSLISSSKSKTSMVEKEKIGNLESENSIILHNGVQTGCLLYSSKSKTLIDQKEKTGDPGFEANTFMYNGDKISGVACAMDLQHGDQGSLGVPVVHRALPEYVAQSHHAFGNSWLPMLAGSTVDLGASGCYPNVALDSGSSLEQASSVSSIETRLTKPSSTCQPLQAQDTVIGEIPRPRRRLRYSEMDFSKP